MEEEEEEIALKIKYRYAEKTVKPPTSWDELSNEQLLTFYSTIFSTPGDEYSAAAFTSVKLIGMAMAIMGVDRGFMEDWEASHPEESGGRLSFLKELDTTVRYLLTGGNKEGRGLFRIEKKEEDDSERYAVLMNRTKNPYPMLIDRKKGKAAKQYYAPADGLGNVTVYELAMCFAHFEAYLNSGNLDHAHKLLAILYRPSRPQTREELESGWGGDRRQKLRGYESKIDERAGRMATLPPIVKRVIVFWFASCRQGIVERFPQVFKSSGGKGNSYGWGGVLLSVAEAGPMGDLGGVSDQNYGNVLTYLSMKADEHDEMQRAANRK